MSAPADSVFAQAAAECTSFRLRKLSRRVGQHYDAYLAQAGLRSTQFSLLGTLMRDYPPTLTQLADLLEMDRTTLTRNLRPLAAAGWVELAPGTDGRTRSVRITEAGRERWRQARPFWREAQRSLHAAYGEQTVARLHAALDEALARMPPSHG